MDVRQRDSSHRDSRSVGQNLAFDFDDAADPSDHSSARVKDLVRPRAAGELE